MSDARIGAAGERINLAQASSRFAQSAPKMVAQ